MLPPTFSRGAVSFEHLAQKVEVFGLNHLLHADPGPNAQIEVEDEIAVFFPCRTSTAVLVQVGLGDAVVFPLMLHTLETFPVSKR